MTSPWTGPRRLGVVTGLTLTSLILTTGLVWLLEEWLGLTDASAAYLLAVVGVAVAFGTLPAVATAAAAFLTYNFLFTHPRFTFIVADSGQLLNLVLLLVVGTVVGQLAGSQRSRAEGAEEREREARVLFQISRALATRPGTGSLRDIMDILVANAELDAAWVGLGTSPGAERPLTEMPAAAPEPGGAHTVLQRRPGTEPARWMPVRPPGSSGRTAEQAPVAYRVPLEVGGRPIGGLWALRSRARGDPRRDQTRMLAAAADQVGQALEQDRLRAEATSAELARQSERMKSALLESVSHDLRTPLTAIRTAAGSLLDPDERPTSDERLTMARAIDDAAARMDRLVGNLLDISRIEAGGLTVDLQPYALEDLLAAALRRLDAELPRDRIRIELPADLPFVRVDALLLDQVVGNLIENAIRYGDGAAVRLSASAAAGRVRLVVEDAGPGVPSEALPRLFDKFYRVPRNGGPTRHGTGLGLAVVRGLVEAMGGVVEAGPSSMGGLAIVVQLPIAVLPAEGV